MFARRIFFAAILLFLAFLIAFIYVRVVVNSTTSTQLATTQAITTRASTITTVRTTTTQAIIIITTTLAGYEDSPFGITPAFIYDAQYLSLHNAGRYDDAHYIGVKWDERIANPIWACVQKNVSRREYNFKNCTIMHGPNELVNDFDAAMVQTPLDIGIVPLIEGWNVIENAPGERFKEKSWDPLDEYQDDFYEFVRKTVERYDGDDDLGCDVPAPDCYVKGDSQYPSQRVIDNLKARQIKIWKLTTEPDWLTGTLDGYDDLLYLTYTAMKEADADARLANGAVPGHPYCYLGHCGRQKGFEAHYVPMLQNLSGRCREFCNGFNGECSVNCLDYFFIHWYFAGLDDYRIHDSATNEDVLSYLRQTLDRNGFNVPIWIANTDTFSGDPDDTRAYEIVERSESQQADDIVKTHVYALSRGVEKVIMEGFMEGYDGVKGCTYFNLVGLIYDGQLKECGDLGFGIRKLSYYSYKLMTEKLEGSDWKNVETITGLPSNVYAYKFLKNNQPVWVLWWDYWHDPSASTKTVTLNLGVNGILKVTNSVPHFENGLKLQNSGVTYPDFFDSELKVSSNGQITLQLNQNPVYIEKAGESPIDGPVIKSVYVEGNPLTVKSNGDLWLNTWADDDNIYSGWGDGYGFEKLSSFRGKGITDFGIARLSGRLPQLKGENVFADVYPHPSCAPDNVKCNTPFNDKPSSLLFIDGRLYAHIHAPYGDPDVGYLAYSDDYGVSWTRLQKESPWTAEFANPKDRARTGSNFRCMFFINMGRNYGLNKDGFVYAFGIGREWGWNEGVYLARVRKDALLNYSAYEYFAGVQGSQPVWSRRESDAQKISGVNSPAQFSSMYHHGINRYLILTEENLYEAPNPWGPWTLAGRWVRPGWAGYQPGIISKDAGVDYFWFTIAGQPSIGNDINYSLSLGKMVLELK